MTLDNIKNLLEEIKDLSREYEEEMWHNENRELEVVFQDIADEIEHIIDGVEDIERDLGRVYNGISLVID